MAIVNGYVTLATAKEWLDIESSDTDLDALIEQAIEAASRGIDDKCKRHFYSIEEARVFAPGNPREIFFGTWNDMVDPDVQAPVVRVDEDGDGAYEEVVAASELEFFPVGSGPGSPRRGVQAVGDVLFPVDSLRRHTVQIEALWGWGAIPEPIQEATLIETARLVKRRTSPEGVMGLNMFGTVKIGRMDPDVTKLIKRYRLRTVG